ncbi:MAG: rod-binding protein [Cellulosilyticaceae bacterium]
MRIDGVGLPAYNMTTQLESLERDTKANSFSSALESAVAQKDDKALMEACKDVETYMISTIFKQMKKSTEMGESLIPKGDYETMFESNMVDEMAKNMTNAGGIGLAKMMYEQMSRK